MLKMTEALFSEEAKNGENVQERPHASVEIFSKIMDQTFSTDQLELKTELVDKQLMVFSEARLFAEHHSSPLISSLLEFYSLYAISKNRKGRKEFESIAKASFSTLNEDEEQRQSIPARLLGGK